MIIESLLRNLPDCFSRLYQKKAVLLPPEVTKRVYFIGNERMLIAHDSNRLRFS